MLLGVDVSQYNGLPSLSGLSFLGARAVYGNRPDPRYALQSSRARAAGLTILAYCFGVPWMSPVTQAKALLSVAGRNDILVLDLEKDGSNGTMTNAQARAFMEYIHAQGRKVGLYHSRWRFPSLGQDFNWVAQWGPFAPLGMKWTFWQYQGSPLDRDKFNGTLADLHKLAGTIPASVVHLPGKVHVFGAWWDYTKIVDRFARVSKTTAGFSASAGPIEQVVFGGKTRQLIPLMSGAYDKHYVDKADPNVDYYPAT